MTYLSVNNFWNYQNADVWKKAKGHPPWFKCFVHRDREIDKLPPLARLLWFEILGAATRYSNVLEADLNWLYAETRVEPEAIAEMLPLLLKGGWLSETQTPRRSRKPSRQTRDNPLEPIEEEEEKNEEEPKNGSSSQELATVTALPVTAQGLVAFYIDQAQALGGIAPPSRVKGQVARLCGEMLREGIRPEHVRAGLELLIERRLHPSTLPSLVHEASLPARQQSRPGRITPSELMAHAQKLREQEEAMFHDAG